MQTEKLQKVLAQLGLGSRRHIEQWILQGRIRVNHSLAKLGDRVDIYAAIELDGRPVRRGSESTFRRRVLLYHKPAGVLCTRHDLEGRPLVFDQLPAIKAQRWILVGRLDLNTSGLLLVSNEGSLVHRLLHPSYEIEREYAVRVLGRVTEQMLTRLCNGVHLEDGWASFTTIHDRGGSGVNHWYHVILKEGRNHAVHRLWASVGVTVSRLIRIRFGSISLPQDLPRGRWRELTAEQISSLEKILYSDGRV